MCYFETHSNMCIGEAGVEKERILAGFSVIELIGRRVGKRKYQGRLHSIGTIFRFDSSGFISVFDPINNSINSNLKYKLRIDQDYDCGLDVRYLFSSQEIRVISWHIDAVWHEYYKIKILGRKNSKRLNKKFIYIGTYIVKELEE